MTRSRDETGVVTLMVITLAAVFLLAAGLVLDGGYLLAARSEAFNEAESAARAGAQALSQPTLRGGAVALDPVAADAAVQAYLAQTGHSGTSVVAGDEIDVTVTIDRPMVILGAFGVGSKVVTARGSARAERGITQAEGP